MKYVLAFGSKSIPPLLGDDASPETVASDCRAAALAFMRAARGWGKADLAAWLTGAYAAATRYALRGERVADLGCGEPIQDKTIEGLLSRVHGELLSLLEATTLSPDALDLSHEAKARALVRKAIGPDGEEVWVPLDGASMGLRDRVLALFAADALNDPDAYRALAVCRRCGLVEFDAAARRYGVCGKHRISGRVAVDEAAPEWRAASDE